MKFRITPLNIVAAAGILAAVLLISNMVDFLTFRVSTMKTLFIILFFMVSLVAFISDLVFRKMISSLKRLWIIEVSLITLTVIFVIVLKALIGK